ncbi:MAG: hypothetical protein PHI35_00970 [Victivallaceae bacterium]|nr:hypothetical protein [Victivallaceae bacterium]
MKSAAELAAAFVRDETQFHLGFLPSEQSNPLSRSLEQDFRRSPSDGVRTLQRVDRNVLEMARKKFASTEFAKLVAAMREVVSGGGRVIFSGCGATGRLSILIESMWRTACAECGLPELAERVVSIMTGGDFAMIKSVESFEDSSAFGRRQFRDLGGGHGDMLVAITEGGETSSVLGTCAEALDRGCPVFLIFNNPAALLCEHLERSRRIIEDRRVTVLDLYCGPMALAGSTRMQATTAEQLISGAALEQVLAEKLGQTSPDYAERFAALLDWLESPECVAELARYIEFERDIYARHGHITYYADRFMLDIFTDTTERAPTFMLPPFRARGDRDSAQSWAFVKDPRHDAAEAWQNALKRPFRCINWVSADYRAMGAAETVCAAPPHIGEADLLKFDIGNTPDADRQSGEADTAVLFTFGGESCDPALHAAFEQAASGFKHREHLAIRGGGRGTFRVGGDGGGGGEKGEPLGLIDHLTVKLALNDISTGVMTCLGRVSGNWMSWVALSNKKLIDRGVRLLAELGGLDYPTACRLIFEAREEAETRHRPGEEMIPAVQLALGKLKKQEFGQ